MTKWSSTTAIGLRKNHHGEEVIQCFQETPTMDYFGDQKVDHFIINEAWLGRRLFTYHTKDVLCNLITTTNTNHKKLIAGQKEWEAKEY